MEQSKRIASLEAVLHECLEYFENRSDVVDGDYGVPGPNKEMQFATLILQTLNQRRPPPQSVECPHCKWGFHPSVIDQHIREQH